MNRLMTLPMHSRLCRVGMWTMWRSVTTRLPEQPKTIKVKRLDGSGYDEYKVPELYDKPITPPVTDICQLLWKYVKTPELSPFTFLLTAWFIGFLIVAHMSFRKVEIDVWHERSRLMDWECIRDDYYDRPVVLYSSGIDYHQRLPASVEETLNKMLEETIRRRELRGGKKRRKFVNFI